MQLKRIDPKAVIYHYFELSASEFSLFDDELDMPVAYGSRNLVDATVRNLPPKVTVAYYKRDGADKISFKKKAFYEELRDEFGTSDPQEITCLLQEKGYDGLIVTNVPVMRKGVSLAVSTEVIQFRGNPL